MKNIILIAPPAAGKGTQSNLLCEKYNLIHISVGDLLRIELQKDGKISQYLKQQMESGNLVKDEIIIEIIKNRLNNIDCKNGFILDGFPRTIHQAEMLEKMNVIINNVFYINVDKETAKKRIVGRLSCPICGCVYNTEIEESIPKVSNVCDRCGSLLEKREDDNELIFENRYTTYVNETQPIIDFYKNKNVLYEIKNLSKMETFNEIQKVLNGDL